MFCYGIFCIETLFFLNIENAKVRNILSQIIAEACEIRENQTYVKNAISQAKQQLQIQNQELQQQQQQQKQDHDSDDDDMQNDKNSRTLKEFTTDPGTLVPNKDYEIDGGTMIAHADYETLVPDSGTMVELESNLGTMVINTDTEDSTLKSKYISF